MNVSRVHNRYQSHSVTHEENSLFVSENIIGDDKVHSSSQSASHIASSSLCQKEEISSTSSHKKDLESSSVSHENQLFSSMETSMAQAHYCENAHSFAQQKSLQSSDFQSRDFISSENRKLSVKHSSASESVYHHSLKNGTCRMYDNIPRVTQERRLSFSSALDNNGFSETICNISESLSCGSQAAGIRSYPKEEQNRSGDGNSNCLQISDSSPGSSKTCEVSTKQSTGDKITYNDHSSDDTFRNPHIHDVEKACMGPGSESKFKDSEENNYLAYADQSNSTRQSKNQMDFIHCKEDPEQPHVISIFKGHVKLKSKVFESGGSRSKNQGNHLTNSSQDNLSSLSTSLEGIVHDSVDALRTPMHGERHASQLTAEDAQSVDGRVRVKQTLFETLPVDALYEHGQAHSSQMVMKGDRKSDLEEVMNDFNSKPLSEINKGHGSSGVEKRDLIVGVDISSTINSFKTFEECRYTKESAHLHESQRVDMDIPFNSIAVKSNAELFELENFCRQSSLHSSQIVADEEQMVNFESLNSMKKEFENKPLDYIGLDERPARHSSQIIEEACGRKSEDYDEDFVLSEPHPSQQSNYHEHQLNGFTKVREKRRNFYEYCNSPVSCVSQELLEDHTILNSAEISGIVKDKASLYADERVSEAQECESKPVVRTPLSNDTYVKPLKRRFETMTISELAKSSQLHQSQCVALGPEGGLSSETRECHNESFADRHVLHTSQVIDPSEYTNITSEVGAKTYAFMITPLSELAPHHDVTDSKENQNVFDSQVKPKTAAFESHDFSSAHHTLHPSQIVGHDFDVISANEGECNSAMQEKPILHSSQKVNYGVVRPPSRRRRQAVYSNSIGILRDEAVSYRDVSFSPYPSESDFVSSTTIKSGPSSGHCPNNAPDLQELDDEDLECLLNYTPTVKKDMPSMVSVMTKGVSAELIKPGQPVLAEYMTPNKRISIGSACHPEPATKVPGTCKLSQDPLPPICSLDKQADAQCSLIYPPTDCSDEPLPPPPSFDESDDISYHPDFVCEISPQMLVSPSLNDVIYCGDGSTLDNPSKCNNKYMGPEEEQTFSSLDQEHGFQESIGTRQSQQATATGSLLCVRDDDMYRKVSTVTVDSYPESDDQWDFVN